MVQTTDLRDPDDRAIFSLLQMLCYCNNKSICLCLLNVVSFFLPDCLCLKDAEKCILFFSFMAARRPGRC